MTDIITHSRADASTHTHTDITFFEISKKKKKSSSHIAIEAKKFKNGDYPRNSCFITQHTARCNQV